ncbi:UPF0220-domain-containing protein [Atractiella rhizophila]|nr:UPF0220-domain-containing protein [Atractiella rhizophila]
MPPPTSVPHHSYDPRRVCIIRFPKLNLGPRKREILVYLAGGLFAIAWWCFIDAAILSSRYRDPNPDEPFPLIPVRVKFIDWIPGLCATLGMTIVNLIDKQRLLEDYDGTSAWKARTFLFCGFSLMAGGLAGSVTILLLKYVLPQWEQSFVVWWGVSNVVQSIAIMLSAVVLWMAQNSDDYEYNLTL